MQIKINVLGQYLISSISLNNNSLDVKNKVLDINKVC